MLPCMIQTRTTRSRHGSRTAPSVSVLLVAAWGIGWIASHASRDAYAHTLFQTFALAERRAVLLATAATTTAVAALPLTGRASFDLPGYLLPRLLAVATAAAIGLWAQTRARTEPS